MAPIRIPEGSVFVPRRSGENVAAELLEAAERIGADRVESVRTTTNGYHVWEDVADEWQSGRPVDETEGDETEEDDAAAKAAADEKAAADAKAAADEKAAEEAAKSQKSDEPEPLPVTAENTGKEIDEYAAGLTPPVDVSKAANKAEKIAILEAARQPKTETAE